MVNYGAFTKSLQQECHSRKKGEEAASIFTSQGREKVDRPETESMSLPRALLQILYFLIIKHFGLRTILSEK